MGQYCYVMVTFPNLLAVYDLYSVQQSLAITPIPVLQNVQSYFDVV
jgi:hypothetical protein